jgi:putative spermidine/putrescine transport system substrate-binding protein
VTNEYSDPQAIINETLDSLRGKEFGYLNRRSFLAYAIGLSAATFLGGCQAKSQNYLSIQTVKKSVPRALIQAFRREIGGELMLDFNSVAQRQDCFDLLQKWQREAGQSHGQENDQGSVQSSSRSPASNGFSRSQRASIEPSPSLCQLGHYWLDRAVALETIAPLDRLQSSWATLAARSPFDWSYRPSLPPATNPAGEVTPNLASRALWGVPYRWSSTAIAYRTDKLGDWRPRDWVDLLNNPDLRGRVILPDSPREVIGLVLKALGASYNTDRPDQVPGLPAMLATLGEQVLTYSSMQYQPALTLGDAWVAVGSSQDIAMMPEYGRTIAAVVPESGTALWADLWVQPHANAAEANAERDRLAQRWIEFCWRPEIAITLSLTSGSASPGLLAIDRDQLPPELRDDALVLPPDRVLAKSEFVQPLTSPEAVESYRQLWRTLRSV